MRHKVENLRNKGSDGIKEWYNFIRGNNRSDEVQIQELIVDGCKVSDQRQMVKAGMGFWEDIGAINELLIDEEPVILLIGEYDLKINNIMSVEIESFLKKGIVAFNVLQINMIFAKFTIFSKHLSLLASTAIISKVDRPHALRLLQHCSSQLRHYASRLSIPVLLGASVPLKCVGEPISDAAHLIGSEDMKVKMEVLILRIQKEFVDALEAEETSGRKFTIDQWTRTSEKQGGGITCVMEGGEVLERAGVNVTVLKAPLKPEMLDSMRARGKDLPADRQFEFFAAGVSSVIHPRNPHVPTMHFNFRYFEVWDQHGQNRRSWFGGGADLTPYYLNEEDAVHFHAALKSACDKHGKEKFPLYKKTCDDYFHIRARGERRGVGGIFFDDLESQDPNDDFKFVSDCADAVIPSYIPIVKRRKHQQYTAAERDWQALRRARYVEFNLVYDRGTKFGYATPGARIESILISLPPVAKWLYRHEPEPNSPEYKLTEVLKNPRDWV
ncbi:Coproporphyrinogen III oxidase aerobic [Trinorchestia longiramus]|nr:Coproporphyrinogen III oxidase aerobic [Trinorchestia longiramus]